MALEQRQLPRSPPWVTSMNSQNPIGEYFTDKHIEEITKSIHEIVAHGGFGKITLVFNKGQIEFIEHTIKQRFNLEKEDYRNR